MPVIRIQKKEIEKLGVHSDELLGNVHMIGADLKGVEGNEILVEFFPDRPDLYTVEGIARAMKFFLGYENDIREYSAKRGNVKIYVDPELQNIRPYIVGAVVKDVNVDELMIKSMMNYQEKLHATVGRNRKKLAIGLHDFDRVKPPFKYVAAEKTYSFVPLGFSEEMTLDEILEKHPKGVEYGHIIKNHTKYPLILDSNDNVLSFPPIINGTLTEITQKTRNIFIDITGTHLATLLKVLNIIVCSFADRGGEIEGVKIEYHDGEIITPQLQYEEMEVEKEYVEKILGVTFTDKEITNSLRKMGISAEINDKIRVRIPPYRMDILHPVDIIEDIAKGYGYENFKPKRIEKYMEGKSKNEDMMLKIAMVGLGFIEIKSLTLTSFKNQYDLMMSFGEKYVIVSNPVSESTETLRSWIIPSLLEIFRKNKHRELPQKIFEIGFVRTDKMEKHLAYAVIDVDADFTMSKSIAERIMKDMGIEDYEIEEKRHGSFIDGRCASVILNGEDVGFFGEMHPQVIENFELSYPVIAGEINIGKIGKIKGLPF